ncbi:LysR family transcriptional regulator [Pseudooceanicola sp. CBS1P-1]|uniref:LysR family transcriptional regulator n=1 Tax=Pseudooceanicola albus TaxID=2692189 RepID=A0A6L7G687_9RHOB|nr:MULTISPECIES: LysR family transcriptional regulator [Pseudooceanicola]MBT9385244.1 LysR family transcriptional regulator [Pseudooceanicola endophyticus]MXN18896.1 LysR family transcriptional regulator [Pseudooceanicola albus]
MALRSKVPSTGALFMFEAAARLQSFTAAAREFNVTQPAISRAIGALERHLGYRLFDRQPTGLSLTEEGKLLTAAIQGGFGQIELVLDELAARMSESRSVTLSVTSAFALHWLMPRFSRLTEDLPEVSLRYALIHGEPGGPLGDADLAIRHAWEEEPGHSLCCHIEERVIPVCSPAYLAQNGRIEDAPGGAGHVLACQSGQLRVPWDVFLSRTDLPDMPAAQRLEFGDYALLMQSAIRGQSVALGWWHVIGSALESGELVPASRHILRGRDRYALVARGGAGRQSPAVRAVIDWLVAEFAALEDQAPPLVEH